MGFFMGFMLTCVYFSEGKVTSSFVFAKKTHLRVDSSHTSAVTRAHTLKLPERFSHCNADGRKRWTGRYIMVEVFPV